MTQFQGKVAIVTGATSGIGAAVAERLVGDGAQVVLCGRRREPGEAVAARLGSTARFVRADMASDDDVHALFDATLEAHGRIDCLVNNAGLPGQAGGVLDLDPDRFDQMIAVNLRAPLIAIRAAAPTMIGQGSGSIINIASVSGYRAEYSGHDYSIAKAGLLHLTRSVAVELARHDIRVNSISPGPIATGIFGKGAGNADHAGRTDPGSAPFARFLPDNQPIPRVGTVDDVAEAALFLAADASAFITGQDLTVDGGLSVGRPWTVFEHEHEAIARAATE